MYSIYKISFEDGFAYVGHTKYSVDDRIRRHLNNPDNAELARRLESEAYIAEILYDNIPTYDIATKIESDEIFALEKPINISGVNPDATFKHFGHKITRNNARKKPKRKRKISPRPGEYTCSMCRKLLNWTKFPKDSSRFNGLHSRCRECRKEVESAREWKEKRARFQRKKRKTDAYQKRRKQKIADRIATGLPAYLKNLREKAGLSQKVLASKFGVNPSYISNLELGHNTLNLAMKRRYKKELGLNIDIVSFLEEKFQDD